MTDDLQLQLAGMKLDRPMKTGAVWAEQVVEVVGAEWLVYEIGGHKKQKGAGRGLLRLFLEACDSSDGVVRFCKKWGVLRLCEHGLPFMHGCKLELFDSRRPNARRESIIAVRKFGSALNSLLRVGAELSQERWGTKEDWINADVIISGPEFPAPSILNPAKLAEMELQKQYLITSGRLFLQTLMRRLIQICSIRPRFFWNNTTTSWQIDLDTEGALSNIPALVVLELMITIADKEGFAICSSCHVSYVPLRRPDPTRRNYCSKCGKKAAWRDAAREFRKNEREKRAK
jgi:hypothetical protein